MVEDELAAVSANGAAPKAMVVPHAGLPYSGRIAAAAYARLRPPDHGIDRVVVLGPSHHVAFHGLAVTNADAYETPLGRIPVDRAACAAIEGLPQVHMLPRAHSIEHSIEVQLPFLQTVLPGFRLVPIVVGDASSHQVAEAIDALWGGAETLIVVSSDLSHHHDERTARRMDDETTHHILALDPNAIHSEDACGVRPLRGLLNVAWRRGLRVETIGVGTSADATGDRDSVVGYGAYAFVP